MLAREDLQRAFAMLGRRAVEVGKVVEIAVYGGSAIVLTFPGCAATRDVDAVLLNEAAWLRIAAREIAEEIGGGWPDDWLNDGVKGWLSERDGDAGSIVPFGSYPSEDEVGLRVFVATPEYLFAMKCMAMRIGGVDATQDRADIELLAAHLGIETAAGAITMISRFYPGGRILPKTLFGVEEIFGTGSRNGRL